MIWHIIAINISKYFGEFEKSTDFRGSFNGYYYPYPTSEERWAFLTTSIHTNMELPDGPAYENLFELFERKDMIEEMFANIKDRRIPTELIPHCPECGRELEPWVRGYTFPEGRKYKEEYEKWNRFLVENKHKKILFL